MIQTHFNLETNCQVFNASHNTAVYKEQDGLIRRALACLEERIKYKPISLCQPQEVSDYLRLQLAQEPNEVFAVLFLDTRHQLLAFEKLFYGTVNSTTIHPRVIIQRALAHNAAAVILAHNHPSGTEEPSAADQYITQELKNLLKWLDVRVLDHFIVTLGKTTSFLARGLL